MAEPIELFKAEFSKKHTSAATNQIVEAYPNESDVRFVITDLIFGGSAAGTLQILDDTNTAIDGYFWTWAAGQTVFIEKVALKKLPKNRGIRYSTTDGGNHSVTIKYIRSYSE
jgi:hypothetical protein